MKDALTLYAGSNALSLLQNNGFSARDVNTIIAASGGPKWFILYHLDRLLYGDFFSGRCTPLATLGSSAGAWQLACLGTASPTSALDRLVSHYSTEEYSSNPSIDEITTKAERMLARVLGPNGAKEIAQNTLIHTHILTDRCRHLLAAEQRFVLAGGLLATAMANLFGRRWLSLFMERSVFHTREQSCFSFSDFPTRYFPLMEKNIQQTLMATGAIPLVLHGQRNIYGALPGVYRDGGMLDYHFDFPIGDDNETGITLFPHFSHRPIAGWFDKLLKHRKVSATHYKNILMVVPSSSLIEQLPFGKISDRNDFVRLDKATRKKYWNTVIDQGRWLADAFHDFVEKQAIDKVKAFVP